MSNDIYSGFVRENKLLEGGRMEIEDSLYILWTRMLKIREEMGIFEMYYLLNVPIVLVRCQFLKTPYLEEVLFLKGKSMDVGAGKFYIFYQFFLKELGTC